MMTQEYRGRGRPRPAETIRRDERVMELVRDHGGRITRAQVMEELDLTASLAWLSLARLRKDGRLVRCIVGREQTWCVPEESGEGQS